MPLCLYYPEFGMVVLTPKHKAKGKDRQLNDDCTCAVITLTAKTW